MLIQELFTYCQLHTATGILFPFSTLLFSEYKHNLAFEAFDITIYPPQNLRYKMPVLFMQNSINGTEGL